MHPDDPGFNFVRPKNITFVLALVTTGKSTLWAHQQAPNEQQAVEDYISKNVVKDAIKRHGKGIVLCGKRSTDGCTDCIKAEGIKLHLVQPPELKLEVRELTA